MAKFVFDSDFNRAMELKAKAGEAELRSSVASLGIKGRGEILKRLKTKFRYASGDIEGWSYRFPRHGIFSEKGVGREVGSKGGVRFPTAKNGTGMIKRKMKPWLSNVVNDDFINEVASLAAEMKADIEVTRIKI